MFIFWTKDEFNQEVTRTMRVTGWTKSQCTRAVRSMMKDEGIKIKG